MMSPELLVIGDGPYNIAVDKDSGIVYLTCRRSNSLSVIDGTNNSVIKKISVISPHDMEIDTNDNKVYVIGKNIISVIDTNTKKPLSISNESKYDTFDVSSQGMIGLDSTRNLIYLLHKSRFNPRLDVLDTNNDFSLINKINVKHNPNNLTIGSKTKRVY